MTVNAKCMFSHLTYSVAATIAMSTGCTIERELNAVPIRWEHKHGHWVHAGQQSPLPWIVTDDDLDACDWFVVDGQENGTNESH